MESVQYVKGQKESQIIHMVSIAQKYVIIVKELVDVRHVAVMDG
jgi:hypothetical protein